MKYLKTYEENNNNIYSIGDYLKRKTDDKIFKIISIEEDPMLAITIYQLKDIENKNEIFTLEHELSFSFRSLSEEEISVIKYNL